MISVCEPYISGKEMEYVVDCIKTNWIGSMGKYIEKFEEAFAEYCGCKYGISTTSGTTALHLALSSLGIGPGDEVIVPTFTMAATIFSILYTGAKPVFVDSNPCTWNIDHSKVENSVTNKTKAIIPVHIYGHPCDMDTINYIAQKHDLYVIEDAAEAHGAEYCGRKTGSLGDVGCFSFYANKIITTGEGGMVVTNSKEVASRARLLKNLAFDPNQRFLHMDIGYNYRMTNIQAAIGLAQLEKIDVMVEARRRNARLYVKMLSNINGLTLPVELYYAKNVYWMFGVLVEDEFGISRNDLASELFKRGIETRNFFYPMHFQPAFSNINLLEGSFPVSEMLGKKGLYLPSGTGLSEEQISVVCNAIKEINYCNG